MVVGGELSTSIAPPLAAADSRSAAVRVTATQSPPPVPTSVSSPVTSPPDPRR
jgi:hypothetical protein